MEALVTLIIESILKQKFSIAAGFFGDNWVTNQSECQRRAFIPAWANSPGAGSQQRLQG
jgi:hypothetical protein